MYGWIDRYVDRYIKWIDRYIVLKDGLIDRLMDGWKDRWNWQTNSDKIDDMNKWLNSNCPHFHSFSVGFRTTPMDSTGVSHILEHTVLCGSKNYPVRDPFFKMISRSLSTFMNAFTGKWVCSTCTHACICTCIYMYMYNCGQCRV